MGHEVKLIPPAYVKPFVKRNKNDAVDAEAICEAAQRPNMRFVAIKSEEQQASALVFRTRDLLVRQRTQNAIRGHLTEYGWVAPKGPSHVATGVGPITATAIAALAPPAETFTRGRDFAAWLGLAPRQLSTGGKQKLGSITKMGERTLRRLIIIGSSAVVLQASKRGAPAGSGLSR